MVPSVLSPSTFFKRARTRAHASERSLHSAIATSPVFTSNPAVQSAASSLPRVHHACHRICYCCASCRACRAASRRPPALRVTLYLQRSVQHTTRAGGARGATRNNATKFKNGWAFVSVNSDYNSPENWTTTNFQPSFLKRWHLPVGSVPGLRSWPLYTPPKNNFLENFVPAVVCTGFHY